MNLSYQSIYNFYITLCKLINISMIYLHNDFPVRIIYATKFKIYQAFDEFYFSFLLNWLNLMLMSVSCYFVSSIPTLYFLATDVNKKSDSSMINFLL